MPDDVLYTVSVCVYDLYVQNLTLGCAESPVGRFSAVTCKLHSTKESPSLMFNFVSEELSRHLMPEVCTISGFVFANCTAKMRGYAWSVVACCYVDSDWRGRFGTC